MPPGKAERKKGAFPRSRCVHLDQASVPCRSASSRQHDFSPKGTYSAVQHCSTIYGGRTFAYLTSQPSARADLHALMMLYVYISLRQPPVLACLDLPVTAKQRSSPWARRTRRELRELAQQMLCQKLMLPQKAGIPSTIQQPAQEVGILSLGQGEGNPSCKQ